MAEQNSVLTAAADIDGWLRPEQAETLWRLASSVARGNAIVEIGSFQGKSTVVLASAAPDGVLVYAIDPHAGNDRGPGEWDGLPEAGQADHEAFLGNLERFHVTDRVQHVREFSQLAHENVHDEIQMLYIDGAHGYGPALSDIEGWGDRVVPGGSMAIHDVYTSVFVTLAVVRSLWFGRSWRYIGRVRSLAIYERSDLPWSAVPGNAVRQAASLPWFAKNVVVKALDAVGLKRLARLGHAPGGGLY